MRNEINRRSTNDINIKKNTSKSKGKSGSKKSGKKKFKNTRLFKLLRTALLILIIIFIVNIISDLFNKKSEKIMMVIGENKIELKNEILADEYGNIYLSKDDIANLYDENIYYNSTDKTVITTYNKHIAVLELEKTTMSVNDTVTEIDGKLKEENGVLYIPFSDMEIVYDFEYSYDKEENVLLVDSTSVEKKEAIVLSNAKVKEGTGLFSKKLEKVKKSEYVTVLGTEGKYTKIRTSSGNIGYIKTKKLSEVELKRESMEEEKLSNVQVLNEYVIVDSTYEVLNETTENNKIVTPNLFKINESNEGFEVENIIDLSGTKFKTYQDWANQSNVDICGTVTLNGSMNKLCSDYLTRTYIINSLYTELIKNRINMICIDFENVDDTEGFYRFIIEMTPRFKEAGIKVLVKYKNGLNKDRLNNIVDYVL